MEYEALKKMVKTNKIIVNREKFDHFLEAKQLLEEIAKKDIIVYELRYEIKKNDVVMILKTYVIGIDSTQEYFAKLLKFVDKFEIIQLYDENHAIEVRFTFENVLIKP